MGYYFTIKTKPIILRKDLPSHIVDFIHNEMYNHNLDENRWKPDHKLFSLQRWSVLFHHCSGNEAPYFKKNKNGYYELFIHADINYGFSECKQFCNWISQYVAGRKKNEYIGYVRPEGGNPNIINLYVER